MNIRTGILLTLLSGMIFTFCGNKNEQILTNDGSDLAGAWVAMNYLNDNITEFRRFDQLADDKAGWVFRSNGSMIDRKNSGWCGTPPISYANYEGQWKENSSGIIRVKSEYWGGMMEYNVEIISIDNDIMRARITY